MLITALAGLGTGLSLIIAIGAQNAFVLRQGIRREHVLLVVTVCAFSDAVLIILGVAGVGALIEQAPELLGVVRWFGAAFLIGYGLLALRRAIIGGHLEAAGQGNRATWVAVLATCLAFTWLNPHVYLDTVLLVGSVANARGATDRWWFAGGAVVGSVVWFSALGYGARFLRPLFSRARAWRVLDALIFVIMLALATNLILSPRSG